MSWSHVLGLFWPHFCRVGESWHASPILIHSHWSILCRINLKTHLFLCGFWSTLCQHFSNMKRDYRKTVSRVDKSENATFPFCVENSVIVSGCAAVNLRGQLSVISSFLCDHSHVNIDNHIAQLLSWICIRVYFCQMTLQSWHRDLISVSVQ